MAWLGFREREHEFGAAAYAGAKDQVAAHAAREAAGEGKADAAAVRAARERIVGAEEALEDLLLEAGRHARAAVEDDELDGAVSGAARNPGLAHDDLRWRAGRVLGGVVEEVGKDPAEGVGIGERGEAALAGSQVAGRKSQVVFLRDPADFRRFIRPIPAGDTDTWCSVKE